MPVIRSTCHYDLFKAHGGEYTIRKTRQCANRSSAPLPLEMVKSLGLLTCSKSEFDKQAKLLCTISARDQRGAEPQDEVCAPVTLPNKLTRAEKAKLKAQKRQSNGT